MVGKRKRDATVVSRAAAKSEDHDHTVQQQEQEDAQERLRRYFEARFEPLEQPKPTNRAPVISTEIEDTDSSDGSDWDGVSDDESADEGPEVVDHSKSKATREEGLLDKAALKSFMGSKPPSSSEISKRTSKQASNDSKGEDDQETDAAHLKNDLALQRLLKESHLLDSASDLTPSGSNRHRALDLRMQTAGAKTSLYKQAKMPMSHRKGINSKATAKEQVRRRDARENGIILEKPTLSTKRKDTTTRTKRERGVGTPAVGKFTGGTLRLSKQDIMDIQGPKKSQRGKGKRR